MIRIDSKTLKYLDLLPLVNNYLSASELTRVSSGLNLIAADAHSIIALHVKRTESAKKLIMPP